MSDLKISPTETSTLKRPDAGSYQSLRGVVAGLSLMLTSMVFLAAVGANGIWLKIFHLPEDAVINVLLTCSVLMLVGQMICVSVPAQSKAKGYAIISAICSAMNCVLWGKWIHLVWQDNVWPLIGIILTQPIVGLVGSISFVLFLRKLSQYIKQPRLVKLSQSVLLLAGVAILIVGVGFALLAHKVFWIAILLAAVSFVAYLMLLGAVLAYLARKLRAGKV